MAIRTVYYSNINGNVTGAFSELYEGSWIEQNSQGSSKFSTVFEKGPITELYDPSRGLLLDINSANGSINYYSNGALTPLYKVTAVEAPVVEFNYKTISGSVIGKFVETGIDTWVEYNNQGTNNFRSSSEDGATVHLYDASRNFNVDIHVDTRLITSTSQGVTSTLYQLTSVDNPIFSDFSTHTDLGTLSESFYRSVSPAVTQPIGILPGALAKELGLYGVADSSHAATFLDGTLLINPTNIELSVFNLYDSAFNRAPDLNGFNYWTNQLQSGTSLLSAARSFTLSPEFSNTYGSLNNNQFVDAIYNNVLNRSPDPAGLAFYTNQLNGGTTRESVLVNLSESTEHKSITSQLLPHGGYFIPKNSAVNIENMYDAFLGRLPDEGGLAGWIKSVDAGTSLQQVADLFATSPEFVQKYAGTSNTAFVQIIYQNTLHRQGEAGGVAYWIDQLASGHTRAEVALNFALSPEHYHNFTQPHIDLGLLYL